MELKNVDKLLKTLDKRKELEAAITLEKKDFENKIALPKAALEDILDEENRLREEILLELEKEKKTNLKYKDRTITYNIKRTRQIEDVDKLINSFYTNREKIETDLGYDITAVFNTAFKTQKVVANKPYLEEIISNYEKVEGENLDGIKIQATKYLTIK